jgi:hypothetical protein
MIIVSMQVRTTERENTTVILSIITLTPVTLLTGTCRAMSGWGGGGGKLENGPFAFVFRRFSCENKTSQELFRDNNGGLEIYSRPFSTLISQNIP